MQSIKSFLLSLKFSFSLLVVGSAMLSGCGGGCVGDACGTYAQYTLGGSVTGLEAGKFLVLQNSGGDNLQVTGNGSFTFATKVRNFKAYNVSVLTHPIGQICTVSKGVGTINVGDVSNVVVTCGKTPYTIGGTITGLYGSGSVVLQNNGTDNLTLHTNGSFTFATPLLDLQSYNITVLTQPLHQTCTVGKGVGAVNANNVGDVALTCVTKPLVQMGGARQETSTANLTATVTTLAGKAGVKGANNGQGTAATFNAPYGVTTDGFNLYVTDILNQTIRKVVISTGVVSTITIAAFNNPAGITTDGVWLYLSDYSSHTIRKVQISTGWVTTVAGNAGVAGFSDGVGAKASFNNPDGITTDGTNLYVSDVSNHTIRKIVIATGEVTTLAGSAGVAGSTDGIGAAALLRDPGALTTDGISLYLADFGNQTIRKIVIATGEVTTLAGTAGSIGSADGVGVAALFNGPAGITTDGTNLYVTEIGNHAVRKIVIATGEVTTLAGMVGVAGSQNGVGTAAMFNTPTNITSDGVNLYVADKNNYLMRKIQ